MSGRRTKDSHRETFFPRKIPVPMLKKGKELSDSLEPSPELQLMDTVNHFLFFKKEKLLRDCYISKFRKWRAEKQKKFGR